MSFRSILVQADADVATSRLGAAVGLAQRFDSRLIGVAAIEYGVITAPYYGFGSAEGVKALCDQVEAEYRLAETRLRELAAAARVELVWRRSMDSPASAIASEARGADLVITGCDAGQDRRLTALASDLVMIAGLPVLVAPPAVRTIEARNVLVAWKNTRETRRAVSDAMPFLRAAERVVVAAVQEGRDPDRILSELQDVAERLRLHGAAVEVDLAPALEMGVPDQLAAMVESQGADMIVAGAYGHSRLREWVFGGVTERLLQAPPVPALLSH